MGLLVLRMVRLINTKEKDSVNIKVTLSLCKGGEQSYSNILIFAPLDVIPAQSPWSDYGFCDGMENDCRVFVDIAMGNVDATE